MKNNRLNKNILKPVIGILQWFHLGDKRKVEEVVRDLKDLNVKYIRTAISWADWHTEGGKDWYDWLLPRLASEFEVLPCFLYTPPFHGNKS